MSDKNAPVQWTLRVSAGGLYRTIQDENGAIIMQVTTHTFRAPEKLDDWQLIAAAPETAAERDRLKEVNAELLAALRPLAFFSGGFRDDEENRDRLIEMCAVARGAIAKAEGKS